METRDDLFLRQQCSSAGQKTGNFLNTRILFPKLSQTFPFYKDNYTSQKNALILHAQVGYERYRIQIQLLIILGVLSTLINVYFHRLSKYFIYRSPNNISIASFIFIL